MMLYSMLNFIFKLVHGNADLTDGIDDAEIYILLGRQGNVDFSQYTYRYSPFY